MATHGEHNPLVDYDDHSSTSQATEDFAVVGGDESPTRSGIEEFGGADNAKSHANDVGDGTARTVADADIPVGDRVDILINALVACAYKNSERTAATKRGGLEDTSLCQNNESIANDGEVANAVGPHMVEYLMHAFTN